MARALAHRADVGWPTDRRPIHALTGLRFAAALLVLVSHLPELVPVESLHTGLERGGAAGVTIFFVLSGFVMTYNYGERFSAGLDGVGQYLRARLARIAPMNIVALVVVTTIVVTLTAGRPSAASWFVNLLMLQALVPVKAFNLWNIPAWSVSAELCFYAAFPLFVHRALGRWRRARHLWWAGGAMFAVAVTSFSVVALLVERRMTDRGTAPADIVAILERLKFFPGLRIWEFFLGCLLGQAVICRATTTGSTGPSWWSHRHHRDGVLTAAVIALFGVVLVPALVDTPSTGLVAHLMTSGLYLTYTPIAVAIVAALAWGRTSISPVLEHRWAQRLGDASLSFYLLQWPMVLVLTEAWAPSPRAWWSSLLASIALAVVSLLTARLIEQPARRAIRGPVARRHDTPLSRGLSAPPKLGAYARDPVIASGSRTQRRRWPTSGKLSP